MNPAYKAVQHEADHLFHRLEGMLDNRAMGEGLAKQAENVREDIESGRGPRSIEDRIKRLQQQLEHYKEEPNPVITCQDAGHLAEEYEQLRRRVRSLPNY
jgi:polyhydroxyalkanoate synthesis regulator phasin